MNNIEVHSKNIYWTSILLESLFLITWIKGFQVLENLK